MTQDGFVKNVALFYFFAFLDETLAIKSSFKTMRISKKVFSGETSLSEVEKDATLVALTYKQWHKYKQKALNRSIASVGDETGWYVAPAVDMGLWRQFMRDSDADEFLAVLWSRVLKITDEAIAKGLGVTVGTVRHRTGRGLRKLSSMRVSVFYDEH